MTGGSSSRPLTPADADVIAAVNAHQRTDKGFGPALGPAAAHAAVARFEALDYSVVRGEADWLFGPADRQIQIEISVGLGRGGARRWRRCARRRGRMVDTAVAISWPAGRSTIRVGHVDLFRAGQTGTR
jgi:hypothetical protein